MPYHLILKGQTFGWKHSRGASKFAYCIFVCCCLFENLTKIDSQKKNHLLLIIRPYEAVRIDSLRPMGQISSTSSSEQKSSAKMENRHFYKANPIEPQYLKYHPSNHIFLDISYTFLHTSPSMTL